MSFTIIFALLITLMMPVAVAEDESSSENSSESSEAESSDESSSPQNPEKCYLSFDDPVFGEIEVTKGYVGFEYSNGRSVYAFTYGDTAVLKIIPAEDARFNFAELNGIDVSPINGVLNITMTENYFFNINFTKIEYKTITVVCQYGDLGPVEAVLTCNDIVITDTAKVLPGNALTIGFTAIDGSDIYLANAYFHPDGSENIDAIIDNDANTVTTLPISCNGTLVLRFDLHPVNVNIIQTVGGTITVNKLHPKMGDSVTFTLTPAEGYNLQCIIINGIETALIQNTHTITVNNDITVSAVFAPISVIVDVNVTLSVIPDTDSSVHGTAAFTEHSGTELIIASGTAITVQFTPDTGYEISEIKVNGASAEINENGTITVTPDEDTTITVSFKKIKFRITAVVTAQGGGSISAVGHEIVKNVVYVDYGDSITFVFTPDMHYDIYSVKADSVTVFSAKDGDTLKDNSYIFTNVVSNHTIAVTFASEGSVVTEYTITATAGEHGSISPSGVQTVVQGESATYTVTAGEGYEIDYVTVDGIDVFLIGGTYTFTAVTADHEIAAYFKAKVINNNGVIGIDDINWTTSVITINLTSTMKIDKSVIDKIQADYQDRTIIIKAADFEISFVVASSFGTAYLQLDLTVKRNNEAPDYTAISSIIASSSQYSSSVYTVVKLEDIFPQSSAAKIFIGNDFAGKLVSYYTYDMGELVRAAENISCDQSGYVTITLKNSKELVFIADATVINTYNVTVTAGENGVVTPTGTSAITEGETFTFSAVPNEGYRISRITVGGEKIEIDGTEYSIIINADTEIDVRFALLKDENSSKAGLIISIVIIAIAIIGGGVLFVIKWKQTKY